MIGRKKRAISSLEILTRIQEMKLAKGAYDELRSDAKDTMTIGYQTVLTTKSSKVQYLIEDFPMIIQRERFEYIRRKVERYGVAFNYVVKMKEYKINWDDPQVQRQQMDAQEKVKVYEERGRSDFDNASYIRDYNLAKRVSNSYAYYNEAAERDRSLLACSIMFELEKTKNNKRAKGEFRSANRELKEICGRLGLKIKQVRFNYDNGGLLDNLRLFSPESLGLLSTDGMNLLLSDEILAGLIGYYSGKIGSVGIPFGRDVHRNRIVYQDLVGTDGTASNILLIGESGAGKSLFEKVFLSMVYSYLIFVVILDVDGEYQEEVKAANGAIVSFKDKYFNTMVISKLTGIEELDRFLLTDSKKATEDVFNCLIDVDDGMSSEERSVFSKLLNTVLDNAGVLSTDNTTWGNSAKLSYKDIYNLGVEYCNPDGADKLGVELSHLKGFLNKLYHYFDKDGSYSYMFQDYVDVNDILNSDNKGVNIVDIVLDLKSVATSKSARTEHTVKQVSACYLTNLITNRNKALKLFTNIVVEEYNRYAKAKFTSESVVGMVSGRRKDNVSFTLVTNAPMDLLKFGDATAFTLLENTQIKIIGKVKEQSVDAVCESFYMEDCRDLLIKIATSNRYKFHFLVKFNDENVAVCKWDLPEGMAENPIFKTRETKQEFRDAEDIEWKDIAEDVRKKRDNAKILRSSMSNFN